MPAIHFFSSYPEIPVSSNILALPIVPAVPTSTDWQDLGACRDSDPGLFFPIGTTGPAIAQIEKAVAICGTCEVRQICLDYALESNQESGVWGGYPEEERRLLRRKWLADRRRR